MQIGGKLRLAAPADKARYHQRTEMKRRAMESHLASIQSYGQTLFNADAAFGQESTMLTLEIANSRIQRQLQASLASPNSSFRDLPARCPGRNST